MPQRVEIPVEPISAESYFASQAFEFALRGVSIPVIARKLGTSNRTIREALRIARQGQTRFDSAATEWRRSKRRLPHLPASKTWRLMFSAAR
jgi:hypothetical protein